MNENNEAICEKLNLSYYQINYWFSHNKWPLFPYCIEEAIRENNIQFSERNCRFMLICYIKAGEIIYSDDTNQEYTLSEGKVFIVPQYQSYSFRSTYRRYYHKLTLELNGLLLSESQKILNFNSCQLLTPDSPTKIELKLQEIHALLRSQAEDKIAPLIAKSWELLSQLSKDNEKRHPDDPLIMKAKAWLEQNLSVDASIKTLAANLGICHSLLNKLFRKKLGMTPQQYRIKHRNQIAQHLLRNTTYSIKEISAKLGYKNQLYFSNEFKKKCGLSPKKFKAKTI